MCFPLFLLLSVTGHPASHLKQTRRLWEVEDGGQEEETDQPGTSRPPVMMDF